jgi:hypothetical protein
MISETNKRVLGPEEQPKSASLKQVGRAVLNMFLRVSSRIGLAFDSTVFCETNCQTTSELICNTSFQEKNKCKNY